ncbi:hypothetical protein [Tenacibaculum agarivorans]|uniref:hypothetical protein n=1 Tax=Tenacibaculum agarivorans TaxID=1908389 RepID=UPI00094BBAE7|nr:hypothetical protein [Tenacibaculum agarivorans]
MKICLYAYSFISLLFFFFSFYIYQKKEKYDTIIEEHEPIKYNIVSVLETSRPSGKSSNKGHVLVLNYKNKNYTIDISFSQYEKLVAGEYIPLYYITSSDEVISKFDIKGRNRAMLFMIIIGVIVFLYFLYSLIRMRRIPTSVSL